MAIPPKRLKQRAPAAGSEGGQGYTIQRLIPRTKAILVGLLPPQHVEHLASSFDGFANGQAEDYRTGAPLPLGGVEPAVVKQWPARAGRINETGRCPPTNRPYREDGRASSLQTSLGTRPTVDRVLPWRRSLELG